jgi:hypothetical protein
VINGGKAAIADHKGKQKFLLPLIEKHARIEEVEEGDKIKVEVRVYDESGQMRVDGKTGKPLTVEQLVAEWAADDEYSDAFQGTGASGSGTPAEGGSGTPTPPRGTTTPPASPSAKDSKRASQDYSL